MEPTEVAVEEKQQVPAVEGTPKTPEKQGEPAEYEKKLKTMEDEYAKTFSHLTNQLAGSRRIQEKLQSELAGLKNRFEETASRLSGREASPVVDLDALIEEGKWKEAVGRISEERVERALANERERYRLEKEKESRLEIWNKSKNYVTSRYPELDPESGNPESEIARLFGSVWSANPRYAAELDGPRLAMQEMEDVMRERGMAIPHGKRSADEGSLSRRLARQNVASRGKGSAREASLDDNEKAFAQWSGIDEGEYEKTKKALSSVREE